MAKRVLWVVDYLFDAVPMFARSWPLLRRFYWQPGEIKRIAERAAELKRRFGDAPEVKR